MRSREMSIEAAMFIIYCRMFLKSSIVNRKSSIKLVVLFLV